MYENKFSRFAFISFILLIGALGCIKVWADQIRLKDGTELQGSILQKDGEAVYVAIPRGDVATVNGKALPDPIRSGYAAPNFSVQDISGSKVTLSDYRGKVVIFCFWATWCPHCRADMPLLKDIYARYKDRGVSIIAASVDKDVAKLEQFVKDQQLPYTVIPVYQPSAPSEQSQLPNLYESAGVPSYFVVDKKGVIAKSFSGSIVEGKQDLEGLLGKLL